MRRREPPLALTLELARAESAGDPYAFRLVPQTYNLRNEDGSYAAAELRWDADLQADLASLARPEPDPAAQKRLGERLRTFLGHAGWEEREKQIVAASRAGRTIHLTLRAAAAELYALPWELCTLRRTGGHLGELEGCLLRYEWPSSETAAPVPDPPAEGGRILFAWSAAGGSVPEAEHLDAIRRACAAGHHSFDEARDVLAGVSSTRLREALAAGPPVAVLHMLCHGGRLASGTEVYGLAWDAPEHSSAAVRILDADAVRRLLEPHLSTLRLVVLCACHGSGVGEPGNALGGVAQALHRAGVPAVVASRQPLSVAGSITLANVLYERMLAGLAPLEEAFLAARRKLLEDVTGSDWAALQLYARASDGTEHRPFVVRPYRGLLAFREEDARCFFGRQGKVDEAIADLSALVAARKPRFYVVTGASGTGKSSLVFAGVVPALQERDGGRWRVVVMRPRDGQAGVDAALAPAERPLLLVVDQFEEIFTDIDDKRAREAFVQRLWALAADPESGATVIVTLRVDYLGRCGEIALGEGERYLEGVAYDEAHRAFVQRMTQSELRAVIERPAMQAGLALDPGLVDQMLKDAGEEPGALPLAEYALDQIWQARARDGARYRLTWQAYTDLGGISGALAKRADAIVEGLDEARRRAVRRLLVQLVDVRGDATRDTRRSLRKDELRQGTDDAVLLDDVLARVAKERLLVLNDEGDAKGTNVEIAHEQLIRSWGRLRAWVDEDRRMLAAVEQLQTWAAEAEQYGALLEGRRLGYARELLDRYGGEMGRPIRELIARSEAREHEKAQADEAQAQRVRNASLMVGARELLARGDPTMASLLLAEVSRPEGVRGWMELVYEVLGAGVSKAVLRGHAGALYAAAWSPDGKRIATASSDKTARIWELDGSGIELVGHTDIVCSVAWSPDGRRVVTASQDKTARVWESDGSGRFVELAGHAACVYAAAWSPDGRRIATACGDRTVWVWHVERAEVLFELRRHVDAVRAVAWSPDGTRIVTASDDHTARIWELDGSGRFVELAGHADVVRSAAWSPDGRRVVTASNDRTARIWELDGSGRFVELAGHADWVCGAEFSPDGRRVVTVSDDKTARVWDLDGSGKGAELRGHTDPVVAVAWSPEGRCVVTASHDRTARVWELSAPGKVVERRGPAGALRSASFSPDGRRVVVVSSEGTAGVWEADGGGEILVLEGHSREVVAAAWTPDGRRVLTLSNDKTIRVWALDGSGDFVEHPWRLRRVSSASFSLDGRRVVAMPGFNTARVWEVERPHETLPLGHAGWIYSASFSRDGGRVITASADRTARVWRLDDAGRPLELEGHTGEVLSASFSPEGARAVTASADRTARVWDLDGSGRFAELKGHLGHVTSAAFSPDGARVVTASSDKTARVWELDGSGRFVELKGHTDEVRAASWSPDGARVVTASADKTARVWLVSAPDLMESLRRATIECLPPEMRETYLLESATEALARYAACERGRGRTSQ